MFWFRLNVWSVAFLVLLVPCYLLCMLFVYPFLHLLNTLSSFGLGSSNVSPDFIQELCRWLFLPAVLMAIRGAFAVLDYVERKEKVLNRTRSLREGKLNDSRFGVRMKGEGIFAEQIRLMFDVASRKTGLTGKPILSAASFRSPSGQQLNLL